MNKPVLCVCAVILAAVSASYAEYIEPVEDSVMRAEILGENDGERFVAPGHAEYQPEKAKEECSQMFTDKWLEHFKEKGFSTSEEVVTTYVEWCVKGYDKAKGR